MRRRRKNEFKNIIIGIIFLSIVFMTAGYAVYSRDLIINGTSKILSDWDIRFSDINLNHAKSTLKDDDLGYAMEIEPPEIATDGLSLTFNVALVYKTDKITYDIDITNYSELFDAEYKGLITTSNINDDYILYEIDNISVQDKIAADGTGGLNPNKKTVSVTAYWNPDKIDEPSGVTDDPDTTYTETVTIKFVFEAAKP